MKTYINPEHLWKYREFDRSVTPAPSCFGIVQFTVSEVAEYLKTHPVEPIELCIIDNERACILDGNHRIWGSIMNKVDMIPVNITHLTMKEAENTLSIHVINRFITI